MKHDELRAIAHNAAASLASGVSILIGIYDVDIATAIKESPTGVITVDFLRGEVTGALPASEIAKAAALFPNALPELCQKHGVCVSAFRQMKACYQTSPQHELRFTVSIEDQSGRKSETDYGGYNGQRVGSLDEHGRLRPYPVRGG